MIQNTMRRHFQLHYIRKVTEGKKPGLIAVNLKNGFKVAIIVFKYYDKFYKVEGNLSYFQEADKNLSIECEEVVLEIRDYLFERVEDLAI